MEREKMEILSSSFALFSVSSVVNILVPFTINIYGKRPGSVAS